MAMRQSLGVVIPTLVSGRSRTEALLAEEAPGTNGLRGVWTWVGFRSRCCWGLGFGFL